jgi:uncharacterized protein YjbJ (UPF0337 family)
VIQQSACSARADCPIDLYGVVCLCDAIFFSAFTVLYATGLECQRLMLLRAANCGRSKDGDDPMDADRIEGAARNIGGKLQDAAGDLLGDVPTQIRGKINATTGKAQEAYGQAKDQVTSFATDQPIGAMLAALGVGLLLGFLFSRR